MTDRAAVEPAEHPLAGEVRARIRDVPDFPKPGILFRDITPVLADPPLFDRVIGAFEERFRREGPDVVIGIESRGFILGAALAPRMGAAFVPVRKPGKLPAETHRVEYELEYGTDALEMHVDAFTPGTRCLLVDDLLATGGTMAATCDLVRHGKGEIVACAFLVELVFLGGRDRLPDCDLFSIVRYD